MVYLKLVDLIEALDSRRIPICSEFDDSDFMNGDMDLIA